MRPHPTKVALLVVDMQNAFCSPRGTLAKRGIRLVNIPGNIRRIRKVLSFFRDKNLKVIFTKLVLSPINSGGLLVKKFPEITKYGAYKPGSWDAEIIKELKPDRGEKVIQKCTYDAFLNTKLDSFITRECITRLYVCGVLANVCVETAVVGAFCRGIEPYLLTDCTTTYSSEILERSIANVQKHFGWTVTSEELLKLGDSLGV